MVLSALTKRYLKPTVARGKRTGRVKDHPPAICPTSVDGLNGDERVEMPTSLVRWPGDATYLLALNPSEAEEGWDGGETQTLKQVARNYENRLVNERYELK